MLWVHHVHAFDDSEGFVAKEILVYSLLPVKGNWSRVVACLRLSRGVNMYLYWRALHTWKRMMWACIEC